MPLALSFVARLAATPSPAPTPPVLTASFWDKTLGFLVSVGLNVASAVGTIVGIIAGAIVLAWLLRILIRRVVGRIVRGAKSKAHVTDTQSLERSPLAAVRIVQRTRTLGSILSNIVNVLVGIIAIVLLVQLLFPNILTSFALLTAALGAGLGFGAQNIVKDVLNGLFIVAEDQVGIGDVVDLELATGVVEYVSVRVTHVRDVNGTLWYVRNGEVTRIGNMSKGWSRVIVDVAVPLDADVNAAERGMLAAANSLTKDSRWRPRITGYPELWGLQSITGETLVLRVVIKTHAHAKDDVASELRTRIKQALDAGGVMVSGLNAVELEGAEGAQRVRGANPPRTKPNPVSSGDVVWQPKRGGTPPGGADAGAGEAGR